MKQEATLIRARLQTPRAAAIAFLWFIGVLRDRLGELEDRFFATVFLGSGLLFLAMLFALAAVAGGIIIAYAVRPEGMLDSPTFTFARAVTYEIMNLYAVKMAAVFMISTSTLAIRTGFTPRWIAFLGFACALLLLLSGRYIDWILLVFPLWVLLISIYTLIDNLRRASQIAAIVLLASEGLTNKEIAQRLRTRSARVSKWRTRFAAEGANGLCDDSRPGVTPRYDETTEQRILAKLDEPPPAGYARWNGVLLAKALGDISDDEVWQVLRKFGISLQRRRSWCVSTDPEFAAKAADVVGLYLVPRRTPLLFPSMRSPASRHWREPKAGSKCPMVTL